MRNTPVQGCRMSRWQHRNPSAVKRVMWVSSVIARPDRRPRRSPGSRRGRNVSGSLRGAGTPQERRGHHPRPRPTGTPEPALRPGWDGMVPLGGGGTSPPRVRVLRSLPRWRERYQIKENGRDASEPSLPLQRRPFQLRVFRKQCPKMKHYPFRRGGPSEMS
jgi:hypothetical protein